MELLSGLASIFGGGLTGLLGAGIQKYFELQTKKLDIEQDAARFAHEADMKKADAEIMASELASKERINTVSTAGASDVADTAAFAVALQSEPKRYADGIAANATEAWLMFLLDFIRGIVRPGLTIYLCAITTMVYLDAERVMVGVIVPVDAAVSLHAHIINTVLYLTNTVVCFWFGTRTKQAAPQ